MSHESTPVGGRLMTRSMQVMLGLFGLAVMLLAVRFARGIGATTALSDGYPWGIWIAFDVVTGTALACGGYAVALMVYVLNRGKYHPLVRSALVTSALGYTLAGFSVIIDLGRWWNVYAVPIKFWEWNLNSILLEVALCIMLYMMVLWVELSPAFLEKARDSKMPRLKLAAERALPWVHRAMPWLIALGILLPTMHQSSLGSLMMLAGPRLHPLWLTPLLPLLFLVTALAMGYGAVIVESLISTMAFKRRSEAPTLARLAPVIAGLLALFAVIRFSDVVYRGRLDLVFAFDRYSILFMTEMLLFLTPAVFLAGRDLARQPAWLFRAAVLVLFGGGLYRFSTFLFAFDPGPAWSYFPAVPELFITLGLVAAEIAAYIAIVRTFPILAGATEVRRTAGDRTAGDRTAGNLTAGNLTAEHPTAEHQTA
jgi:Ni/Fe-hydrogenase subunit HybB-like protein